MAVSEDDVTRHRQPTDERDAYVPKHTPPAGVPAHVDEQDSAACSHDPILLRELRSKRPTDKRLEILESKHDDLQERYDKLVRQVLSSRTKIIVAVVGAFGALVGYLLGACA